VELIPGLDPAYERVLATKLECLLALTENDVDLLGRAGHIIVVMLAKVREGGWCNQPGRLTPRIDLQVERLMFYAVAYVIAPASNGRWLYLCRTLSDGFKWAADGEVDRAVDPVRAGELERPFLHAKVFVELGREHSGLADLLEGVSHWAGEPEDFGMLIRQLGL
jgi:hypothetical protein